MIDRQLFKVVLLLLPFLFIGCEKYYLTVKRDYVGKSTLASTFVGSPDPLQKNPPKGQELLMEWRLPPDALKEKLQLVLKILYKNYTQETIVYPVDRRRGIVTFSLLNDDYRKTEGFLTYKAYIENPDGKVLKQWQQLLWTDLIIIDESLAH